MLGIVHPFDQDGEAFVKVTKSDAVWMSALPQAKAL